MASERTSTIWVEGAPSLPTMGSILEHFRVKLNWKDSFVQKENKINIYWHEFLNKSMIHFLRVHTKFYMTFYIIKCLDYITLPNRTLSSYFIRWKNINLSIITQICMNEILLPKCAILNEPVLINVWIVNFNKLWFQNVK